MPQTHGPNLYYNYGSISFVLLRRKEYLVTFRILIHQLPDDFYIFRFKAGLENLEARCTWPWCLSRGGARKKFQRAPRYPRKIEDHVKNLPAK